MEAQEEGRSVCWVFDIKHAHYTNDNPMLRLGMNVKFVCWYTHLGVDLHPERRMANYSHHGYIQMNRPVSLAYMQDFFEKGEDVSVVASDPRPDVVLAILQFPYAVEIHHYGVPTFTIQYDSKMADLYALKKGKHYLTKACKIIKKKYKVYGELILDEFVRVQVRLIGQIIGVDLPM